MNRLRAWLPLPPVIAAACATLLLLAQVGYRFYLSASYGFAPYANHVSSFDDIFLCMEVGAASFFLFSLLNVVGCKNRKLFRVGVIGMIVFILTVAAFFLMRKLHLISTYEEFVAHGV